jgi:hypothetical protein
MKSSLSVVVAISMAIGTTRIIGCESTNEPPSQESVDGFDGGNGAFGESTSSPGAHPDDAARNPSRQPPAPTASNSH